MICDRQLHCTRFTVPANTDLYKFNNADSYPCMYKQLEFLISRDYLVSGEVRMITSTGIVLREFHSNEESNLNHLLQPACALLGRVLHEKVRLECVKDCEVIQYLFRVSLD